MTFKKKKNQIYTNFKLSKIQMLEVKNFHRKLNE